MCRVWRRSSSREVRLVGSRLTSLGDVGGSGRPPYCTCSKAFSPPRPADKATVPVFPSIWEWAHF
jgi:hypothetical protein